MTDIYVCSFQCFTKKKRNLTKIDVKIPDYAKRLTDAKERAIINILRPGLWIIQMFKLCTHRICCS
jgi:hypothetical protein